MVIGYIFGLVLLVSIHMSAREILMLGRLVATVLGKSDATLNFSVPPLSSAVGAVPPAVPVPRQQAASLFHSESSNIAFCSADELCDELLKHMLDCDVCLAKGEHACSGYRFLHRQIAAHGGPRTGVVFAI
jgi:hypothetical protein